MDVVYHICEYYIRGLIKEGVRSIFVCIEASLATGIGRPPEAIDVTLYIIVYTRTMERPPLTFSLLPHHPFRRKYIMLPFRSFLLMPITPRT